MAISFNAGGAGNNAAATNTVSWTHTCTGSNLILLVYASQGGSTTMDITGITYNGVALTNINNFSESSSGSNTSIWYLLSPATGSQTIIVTSGTARVLRGISVSYTGVKQSGQPDASTSNSDIPTATSYTKSTTTIADNCWVVIGGRTATGALITASTNVTKRQGGSESDFFIVGDTNAVVSPAGAVSQTINFASSTKSEVGTVSIAPAVAALTRSYGFIY